MDTETAGGLAAITQREHHDDASSKKVVQRYQNPSDGEWYNSIPEINFRSDFDYIGFTSPDSNGNYQVITFKNGGSGGTAVRTLSLTYDSASNITSITKT